MHTRRPMLPADGGDVDVIYTHIHTHTHTKLFSKPLLTSGNGTIEEQRKDKRKPMVEMGGAG